MSFQKVKDILNRLTQEHKVLLKESEQLEKELEENFSTETIDSVLKFIEEKIGEHARVEEEDLEQALEEAGITEFDIEALNFGHRTLDEIADHIKYVASLYREGKKDYMGKDIKAELIKSVKLFFSTLKDHFTEEEHFFFPDILKYDLERFE